MKTTVVFQKGKTVKTKKFIVAGDLHSVFFIRDHKVGQFVDTYLGKLFYSRVPLAVTASIREQDKQQTPPNNLNPLNINEQIEQLIEEYRPEYVILSLGQFDIEFDYYYRSIIEGKDVDDFIEELVKTYRQYILDLSKKYGITVVIKGINPSTLIHEATSRSYVSLEVVKCYGCGDEEKDLDLRLRMKQGLQKPEFKFNKRFELTYQFNIALQKLAEELGIYYFDIWDEVIDPNTGLVDLQFMPAKGSHYLLDTFVLRQIHYDALYKMMSYLQSVDEKGEGHYE